MSNLEEHMDEDKGDDSYDNEVVAGFAPRWAWNVIDELLRLKLDCDGDVVVPGEDVRED